MEKLPPIEKIPEAYSAIADNRITLYTDWAEIRSSNGQKTYEVRWTGNTYSSTDSATYWQGYAGYPILAVLLLQGKLPLDRAVAARFKGVDWNALNAKHKRDYAKALAEVLQALQQGGVDTAPIVKEIEKVYQLLPALPITTKRGTKKRKETNG